MYSDVSQNSADGSNYLVHEIRRQMNVISLEAQPSAGMFPFPFHFILCLNFGISSLLGFIGRPAPPHITAVPSTSAYFMCLFPWLRWGWSAKQGAVAVFHLGVRTLLPSGTQTAKQIALRAFNKSEYTSLTVFHWPDQIYPREKREGKENTGKSKTQRRQ